MRLQHPTHQADHRGSKMKRLLTLTLCLLTTGSAFNVLADPCDNLRNNQQAYRDCVNDWYGRSNRGSAPTPWWKNYDPNAGSDSGSAEQPQQYRPYVAPYVPPDPRERERRERGIAQSANLSEHGVALYKAGRFEEAVAFHRQALDLVRQYDSNSDNQAKGAYNLGLTLLEIKQYAEAETLFREALAIRERGVDLGKITNNHSSALEYLYLTIDNLATAIEGQSQYERAEPLRKRVYELRQKSQSVDHMDTWLAYRRLHANRESQTRQVIPNKSPEFNKQGTTHSAAGKYTEPAAAQPVTSELSPANKALWSQSRALEKQGAERYAEGKYPEAAEIFRTVLKNQRQLADNPHGDKEGLEIAYYNLGMSLFKMKSYPEAESMLKESLAIRENDPAIKLDLAFYSTSVATLNKRLRGLTIMYTEQKKHTQAEPYARRILALLEKTRGPDDAETLASLNSLGVNLNNQSRFNEAEALFKRGLAATSKSERTAEAATAFRENLAIVYRNTQRDSEAEALLAAASKSPRH